MSRLIEINETRVGSIVHQATVTKLLGSKRIQDIVVDGSGSLLYYKTRTGAQERALTESVATVKAAVNLANTSNMAERIMSVTVNRTGNTLASDAQFPMIRQISTNDVVEINEDPDTASDSVITLQPETIQGFETLFVDETVATLLIAGNG